MEIFKTQTLSLALLTALLSINTATYGQSADLTNLCKQALTDLDSIQAASNDFIKTSNQAEYQNKLSPLNNKWIEKQENDVCATRGCDLESDELKISLITTKLSGLSSKLLTQDSNQLMQELTANQDENFISKSRRSVQNLCGTE